jgi:hypothetical protein
MITLDAGETIKKIIRPHKLLFLLEAFFIAVIAFLPFALYQGGALSKLVAADASKTGYLLLFFYSMWLLVCWLFLYVAWLEYYLNAWVITDARVMIAKQTGFLRRKLEGVRFDKIQEVVVGLKGTIKIILSQNEGTLTIHRAPHPEAIKELIVFEQKKTFDRLKSALSIDEEQMDLS